MAKKYAERQKEGKVSFSFLSSTVVKFLSGRRLLMKMLVICRTRSLANILEIVHFELFFAEIFQRTFNMRGFNDFRSFSRSSRPSRTSS